MPTSLPWRFGVWRAALLLAAATFLTPGRAEAGCGDHVTILNESGEPAGHAAASADDSAHPARQPCRGPNCSGSPLRDPAPPTAAPAGPQVQEVVGPIQLSAGADESTQALDPEASGRPVRRPSNVFHPPRAG